MLLNRGLHKLKSVVTVPRPVFMTVPSISTSDDWEEESSKMGDAKDESTSREKV